MEHAEPAQSQLGAAIQRIEATVAAAVARARGGGAPGDGVPPWEALGDVGWPAELGLDALDQAIVMLAHAPSLAPRIGQGMALLRADPDRPWLSLGALLELLGAPTPPASLAVLTRLMPGARLVDLGLVEVPDGGARVPTDAILPSRRVLQHLAASTPTTAGAGRPSRLDPLVLPPTIEPRVLELLVVAERSHARGGLADLPLVLLGGVPGAGRGLLAAHVAARLGRGLERVALAGTGRALLERAGRALLDAALGGRLLYVEGLEALTPEDEAAVSALLLRHAVGLCAGRVGSWAGQPLTLAPRAQWTLELPLPEPPERRRLFVHYLPRRLHDAELLDAAAHRYRLTGAQVRAVCLALSERPPEAGPLTTRELDQAVRTKVAHALGSVARLVEPKEALAAIVAPAETTLLLRVMVANFRHRRRVLETWGFAERFGRGLGLSALFSGPPGTGKTMAAGAVARELGLPLYQIELSQVVSKWVGETEKQLDRVFAEAMAASAVILFDEADSLFARRTDVGSANDRYANLEVNHLLQRIEAFAGVVVLTTNNLGAIDPAFLRRFAYHVAFPLPGADERAELWRRLVPAALPIAGALDCERLGREFEFSGGHIKNALLRAAFFAAELGRPVDQRLVAATASLELKQLGRVVRHLDLESLVAELDRRPPG